ncbi:ATP-binding protein [Streptomyces sp. NPDC087310]
MEPASVHVAQARGTTATALRQWALPDGPAEDALLVVSELVTNGISHGSGDVRLRVRHDHYQLLIEVKDGSFAPARRRRTGANDHGGRGLLLVACVTSVGRGRRRPDYIRGHPHPYGGTPKSPHDAANLGFDALTPRESDLGAQPF